jgi:DNA-binding transcriptional ArsR family regulator
MARQQVDKTKAEEVLKSPIRMRILGWLAGQGSSRTKREVGRALSLANAAVHYHLTRLVEAGLVKFEGTRPGPNGITEKLYSGKAVTAAKGTAMDAKQRDGLYLAYTLDSIAEMHREAEELVKADRDDNRFLVGCYGVHATNQEIRELKKRLLKMLEDFHRQHWRPGKNTRPMAVTFGIVPSSGLAWGTTQKVFDTIS